MKKSFLDSTPSPEFPLWDKLRSNRVPTAFELEITARCNNNCAHCYINLPANDKKSMARELSLDEIRKVADEAAGMGAMQCLLTGGEPLLRKDFSGIYLYLKKIGLLPSVFTNAALINQKHIDLFKRYPPRNIEVSVYGVTEKTYERVTRVRGSFKAFIRGINLLMKSGVKVRFKAMALRSNVHELPAIAKFCRGRTKDYFRFDPQLHLRFDRDARRNEQIKAERLSPEGIAAVEKADDERFGALKKSCDKLILSDLAHSRCNRLFHCSAGSGSFAVSYDGLFRLCSSLWDPRCVYDLRKGSLKDAWRNFIPRVRNLRSNNKDFLEKCRKCGLTNLCLWCPAHSYLETGRIDTPVDYFCNVAHARSSNLHPALPSIKV